MLKKEKILLAILTVYAKDLPEIQAMEYSQTPTNIGEVKQQDDDLSRRIYSLYQRRFNSYLRSLPSESQ